MHLSCCVVRYAVHMFCAYRSWVGLIHSTLMPVVVRLGQFTVYYDHNPLQYVRECAPKSAKLLRWALALQEFETLSSDTPRVRAMLLPTGYLEPCEVARVVMFV